MFSWRQMWGRQETAARVEVIFFNFSNWALVLESSFSDSNCTMLAFTSANLASCRPDVDFSSGVIGKKSLLVQY